MPGLRDIVDEAIEIDVLVVGSEGAGARACIAAHDAGATVLCVTKGFVGKTGATLTADADVDVDSRSIEELWGLEGTNPDDSKQAFFEDMVQEGDFMADQRLVQVHVEDAPARVKEFTDWGARIDKLTHAPGHRYPRGIWIEGPEWARVLTKEIRKRKIGLIECFMMTDLLTRDGQCVGIIGLDFRNGKTIAIEAKATILCTGGAMRMYKLTTAPEELTGDGLAAAYRAGAELMDMEFPMFLPYVMMMPAALYGVDFTYLLSAYLDAHSLNKLGERHMVKWDPVRFERTTRDVNSIGQMFEVLEHRGTPNDGTWLSLTHIPRNVMEAAKLHLPESMGRWQYGAFKMLDFLPDITKDAIETAPACHFWNGGIRITEHCETTVPGLYAAGEGSGGIHGSNRVSGNALTMTQVWGPRAGNAAAKFAKQHGGLEADASQAEAYKNKITQVLSRDSGEDAVAIRNRIRQLSHLYLNAVRKGDWIAKVIDELAQMREAASRVAIRNPGLRQFNQEWVEALQLENLLTCMEAVSNASIMREESRGACYRPEFPETNGEQWLKNIIVRRSGDRMTLRTEPVVVTSFEPPRGKYKYGTMGV
ncbi:MAG TPA: FAD-binding protein [Chloroflexota bacterium]